LQDKSKPLQVIKMTAGQCKTAAGQNINKFTINPISLTKLQNFVKTFSENLSIKIIIHLNLGYYFHI